MEKKQTIEKKRDDIDSTAFSLSGLAGLFETTLRRFRIVVHIVILLIVYGCASILMGLCVVPGIYLFTFLAEKTAEWPQFFHYLAMASSIVAGYLIYGFCLILVLPLANFILRTRLKPWRGIYYSIQTVRWYIHNALTYIARYTFLNLVTPTPFNIMFYRLMGMKIGRGSQINTTNISDPSLMEIGKSVSIGGSATIICHYGVGGYLVIAPVRIGNGATIGLRAIIMGDVEIGERAKVLANSVVMPKTRIPPGEIWGGIPAARIETNKGKDTGDGS